LTRIKFAHPLFGVERDQGLRAGLSALDPMSDPSAGVRPPTPAAGAHAKR
jgi:hypothetical protein